ncbi:FUSC family protein [Streptomyces sp. NPDC046805]|uniref:FUSC family protein n=1 Tax=Streptomyces sp. NPDC046805 TaxID=3155134 RepID=UPI0033E303FE
MPSSRPPSPAAAGNGWRCAVGGVARVLSPRGAFALHRVDGALTFALRAALAMALPAVPTVLAGRPELAVYAMLGSFTTSFGRNLPYAHRARALAWVALAMTVCVGCGSALAAWAHPEAGGAGAGVVVAATAVVAGLAKFTCDAMRLSGLGTVLLIFSFAVAANSASTASGVLPQTGMAAVGAAVAWMLAVAGWLVHPDRPQRLAVAAALRELADLLEQSPDAVHGIRFSRHRATSAVLQAYRCLGLSPPVATERGDRGGVCTRLTDLAWSLLIGSARRLPHEPDVLAGHLRRQVPLLTDRRRRDPPLLSELSFPSAAARAGVTSGMPEPGPEEADASSERAAELLEGRRPGGSSRLSVLAVPALRMFLGTGLAGALAYLLGFGHDYWAAISAAAVLHSVNVRTTVQRAVQRTLGTFVGLLIALGVLAADPGPTTLVLVIVGLEFLLEYVVVSNYGLGVVFVTPLALLLTDLVAREPAGELVQDRALSSILGIIVGLACALLVVHDRAAVRVERALAGFGEAAERAERALAERAESSFPEVQQHLAAAVVELREADDAAAGEVWQSEIDPAELAAAEQRAYLLLERFVRWR